MRSHDRPECVVTIPKSSVTMGRNTHPPSRGRSGWRWHRRRCNSTPPVQRRRSARGGSPRRQTRQAVGTMLQAGAELASAPGRSRAVGAPGLDDTVGIPAGVGTEGHFPHPDAIGRLSGARGRYAHLLHKSPTSLSGSKDRPRPGIAQAGLVRRAGSARYELRGRGHGRRPDSSGTRACAIRVRDPVAGGTHGERKQSAPPGCEVRE